MPRWLRMRAGFILPGEVDWLGGGDQAFNGWALYDSSEFAGRMIRGGRWRWPLRLAQRDRRLLRTRAGEAP